MSAKAIETIYNGYKFRSRLEARWAVFFDECGIEYQYEPEGFDLGDGYYYLPDFYLPEQDIWIEIKGKPVEGEDREKIIRFAREKCKSGKTRFRLLVGQIPNELLPVQDKSYGIPCVIYASNAEVKRAISDLRDEPAKIVDEDYNNGILLLSGWIPCNSQQRMISALIKARQARFEHGESG